jgi:hypothetical protein
MFAPAYMGRKRILPMLSLHAATTLLETPLSPLSSRAKPRDLQFHFLHNEYKVETPLPCHPERTRISYSTALTAATYVVLLKENHMHLTEAATLDRKSGGAEGPAVSLSPQQMFRSGGAPELTTR